MGKPEAILVAHLYRSDLPEPFLGFVSGGLEGHARIANRQVARSCLRDAPSRAWTAIPRKMVPK
jgi:hypothetical protein